MSNGGVLELTRIFFNITVTVIFLILVFICLLHHFLKCFLNRHTTTTPTSIHPPPSILHHGLEPSALKSIPIITFPQPPLPNPLECTVCLSDITHGEKLRLLPTCNHGFHVKCIDIWFQSHSTCPVCRNSVSESSMHKEHAQESVIIPTIVLFGGNETQGNVDSASSSSSTFVSSSFVIDVPSSINEEEQKSNLSPSRMRSLKKLLSRDWSNPPSPRIVA